MKIVTKKRIIHETFIVFDDVHKTSINIDMLIDLIEELDDADGYFERVLISDKKLTNFLEANDIVLRSTRGSYSKGKTLSNSNMM